jgi:predicted Rossmann fold flavoprotein
MTKFDLIIIGAGPAGITAAISAKRKGSSVLLCERLPSLGKKILASGGGRCNLLNEDLNESYYNPEARLLVKSVLSRFGKDKIEHFFRELGLFTYSDCGRIFPVTNQSASVLKVLGNELEKIALPIGFNFTVTQITPSGEGFAVCSDKKRFVAAKVIIAAGGRSYPALGSDGSCYRFAQAYGHNMIEPVPACVPIMVKDRFCHILQGQKIFACVKAIINDKIYSQARADLLFTQYGLSGTAILDISRDLSIALNRQPRKDAGVSVDFVPFLEKEALLGELFKKAKNNIPADDWLTGILPNKFNSAFKDLLNTKKPDKIAAALKDTKFAVAGTRGWNEAEFTSGGIDTKQIKESTLESKLKKGLYFCGEILDVDGKRGGYNLAWAFSSGFVAGLTE